MSKTTATQELVKLQQIVQSDLPKSEVISTLSKRVLESRTEIENYQYVLTKYFMPKLTFDGLKDFNYTEYHEQTTGKPYDDPTMDDFKANTNKAIRETAEAKTEHNYKTRILNKVMLNFRTNPMDTIGAIFQSAAEINKVQEKQIEKALWEAVNQHKTVEHTQNDMVAINKAIYNWLTKAGTTSKKHDFIGTNGVIEIDGDTVNPSYKFNSADFIKIDKPEFEADTTFEGERAFFNWNAKQKELKAQHTLDLSVYEGINDADRTELQEMASILIHKDAFEIIMDWVGSGIANAGKLYQVIHNYTKWDIYKLRNKPIVAFKPDLAKNGKKSKKEADTKEASEQKEA